MGLVFSHSDFGKLSAAGNFPPRAERALQRAPFRPPLYPHVNPALPSTIGRNKFRPAPIASAFKSSSEPAFNVQRHQVATNHILPQPNNNHNNTTSTQRATMSRLLQRQTQTLRLLTPSIRTYSSSFRQQPAPPKLAPEQQAEFERLQRKAAVSSAFNPPAAGSNSQASAAEQEEDEDVNQGLFRGAKPEFKGDTNPKTGEVGGPKNEPLRWGGEGDWSYNGRATDF